MKNEIECVFVAVPKIKPINDGVALNDRRCLVLLISSFFTSSSINYHFRLWFKNAVEWLGCVNVLHSAVGTIDGSLNLNSTQRQENDKRMTGREGWRGREGGREERGREGRCHHVGPQMRRQGRGREAESSRCSLPSLSLPLSAAAAMLLSTPPPVSVHPPAGLPPV